MTTNTTNTDIRQMTVLTSSMLGMINIALASTFEAMKDDMSLLDNNATMGMVLGVILTMLTAANSCKEYEQAGQKYDKVRLITLPLEVGGPWFLLTIPGTPLYSVAIASGIGVVTRATAEASSQIKSGLGWLKDKCCFWNRHSDITSEVLPISINYEA